MVGKGVDLYNRRARYGSSDFLSNFFTVCTPRSASPFDCGKWGCVLKGVLFGKLAKFSGRLPWSVVCNHFLWNPVSGRQVCYDGIGCLLCQFGNLDISGK